jgi:hypothetical protein
MKQTKMEKKKIGFLSIVENEWREAYDREWGLALVVSTPNDGRCWVVKILKDDEGYFIAPENAYRSVSKLRSTNYQLTDLSIKFESPLK